MTYLAHKCQVESCIQLCQTIISNRLPPEKSVLGFELSTLFDIKVLTKNFNANIANDPTLAFESSDFYLCSKQTLMQILKLPLMCSASAIFDACVQWAKSNKNHGNSNSRSEREILGECLYRIPFQRMNQQTITEYVSSHADLFTIEEKFELLQIALSKRPLLEEYFKIGNESLLEKYSKTLDLELCEDKRVMHKSLPLLKLERMDLKLPPYESMVL